MTATGKRERDAGIGANLAASTAAHRDYRDHAETVLAEFIRGKRMFSADDVRSAIPDGVEPHSPNVLPSLIGAYATKGVIRPAGWINSSRPTRHASRNRMWIAA